MEAQKYIKKSIEKRDGKFYENRVFEIRELNLTPSEWSWIYLEIMNDDYECAQDNGFYENENGFFSLDCTMVAERMEEWKEESFEDYDESLEDKTEEFQNMFNRIQKLLNDNLDFDIYYKED